MTDRLVVPAVLVAVAGLTAVASAQVTYSPVALSGVSNQYGPGMGAGVVFSPAMFNATPVVNNAGGVIFRAQVGTNDGVWVFGGGANSNVAIGGGARPGGGTYPTGGSQFNSMALSDNGEWLMRLGASSGAVGTAGGVAYRMALGGDTAPGTGSATFATSAISSGMPLYNQSGQAAFTGTLTTGTGTPAVTITSPNGNASGLWTGAANGVSLALRQNQTSTLLDAGQAAGESRVGSFQSSSLGYNGNNAYVMSVALQGSNVVTGNGVNSNNGAILTNRNGSLEVIARSGAAAPDSTGAASAELYRGNITTSAIAFNNAGNVAFVSGLRNGAGTQTASSVLFTDAGGVLRQVGRNATALPTIYNPNGSVASGGVNPNGTNWNSFTNPILNGQGTLAFVGSYGANFSNAVITMDTAGTMTSLAHSGVEALGITQPLTSLPARFNSFSGIQMNSAGQVVFQTTLINEGGITGADGSNRAIYGWDAVAGLQLIAHVGDSFTVAAGDVRTISGFGGVGTTGGQDGRAVGLNNNGQFALTLDFTDGTSGVFLATIPTPGAGALLGMAGLAAARRKRRA